MKVLVEWLDGTIIAIPFCSDSCHQDWHLRQTSGETRDYEGWNRLFEKADYNEYCANCGVISSCGPEACECQRGNLLVNRFVTKTGKLCAHGNWIQLPKHVIDPE